MAEVFPLLWREEPHWNPTVNKMTGLVLDVFERQDTAHLVEL